MKMKTTIIITLIITSFVFSIIKAEDEPNYKIFPFSKDISAKFDNKCKSAKLNRADLESIDKILTNLIGVYNKSRLTEYHKLRQQKPTIPPDIKDYVIDLKDYKRQYIAVINSKGQKEVWVNCICNAASKDWKKGLIIVLDGGKCYFNVKINLKTKKFSNFVVNGDA